MAISALITLQFIALLSPFLQQESTVINKTLSFVNQTIPNDSYVHCTLNAKNSYLSNSALEESNVQSQNLSIFNSSINNTNIKCNNSKIQQSDIIHYSKIQATNSYFQLLSIDKSNITLAGDSFLMNSNFTKSKISAYDYYQSFSSNFKETEFDMLSGAFLGCHFTDTVLYTLDPPNATIGNYTTQIFNSFVNSSSFAATYFQSLNVIFERSDIALLQSDIVLSKLKSNILILHMSSFSENYALDFYLFDAESSQIENNTIYNTLSKLKYSTSSSNTYYNFTVRAILSNFSVDYFVYANFTGYQARLEDVKFEDSNLILDNSNAALIQISNSTVSLTQCNVGSVKIFKGVIFVDTSFLNGTFIDTLICDKDSKFSVGNIMINSKIVSFLSVECQEEFSKFEKLRKEIEANGRRYYAQFYGGKVYE